mmetsp:Transcript_109638/g.349819  ORF Transcript_109638/g.349819 Transcript_109638/m.349819 type:complete len:359 (-) Transcript_109638:109-1185(-)
MRPNRAMNRVAVCARQLLPSVVDGGEQDVDLDAVAYGFMASQALFAALDLSLFDHLAADPLGAEELGRACGVSAPRLQTLLTSLVATKCLRLDPKTLKYSNSPNVAQFMVSTSKHYYGDYLKFQIGKLFYHRMGRLSEVMKGGEVMDYQSWFSDPQVASTYTAAQHNGSLATARAMLRKVSLSGATALLDVGGGSGAFSIAIARSQPGLTATVLELPEVCRTGSAIVEREGLSDRIRYVELDATSPGWPVAGASYQVVLMSYLSGSVPTDTIIGLYANAYKALVPGGRLIVHDFMVDDSLDGPQLGALWALQHVTVNPEGLGLCPANVVSRMSSAGFRRTEVMEMIGGMTKVIVGYKD